MRNKSLYEGMLDSIWTIFGGLVYRNASTTFSSSISFTLGSNEMFLPDQAYGFFTVFLGVSICCGIMGLEILYCIFEDMLSPEVHWVSLYFSISRLEYEF